MNTSSLKRSLSKDDASSLLRDSGISISEEFSENDQDTSDFEEKNTERDRKKREKKIKKEQKEKNIKKEKNEPKVKKEKKPRSFECAVCSKSFKGGTDLRRHLLIHSNEKPHVCQICHKAYRQMINLRNHEKVAHSSQKEFVCQFCAKPFPIKQRLKLHMRLHTGEKPYSCPHCSKTFARGGQLQQHLATHDENKPKKSCELCPATFSSERNLKLHMERHDERQNHVCQICSQVFLTEKAMRVHMNSVHGDVTEFECLICEKTIKEELQTHMKIHAKTKPFECEECKMTFAQKCQYIIHKRVHTGERPFQCRVCWQSFGHSQVLKLHIRKHTGEKPFKCILCRDSHIAFSQLSHLKTHMKTIHQNDKPYVCEGCRDCFKVKFQLEAHRKSCSKSQTALKTEPTEVERNTEKDTETLSSLRYLIAVLLKKISTEEKLTMLGFDKRLIDNVLIASLKLANRKSFECKKMDELDRMKLNIHEFLEWIVPTEVMEAFKKECPTIEGILEKIVTLYLKQVQ